MVKIHNTNLSVKQASLRNLRVGVRRIYLDDSHQAFVSGWISGHREPAGGIASSDFVDSIPGWCVGLVLVSHRQVGHNDIHPVFRYLTEKLHE